MSLKDKLNEYDCLAKTKKLEELKEAFQNKFDSEEGKYSPRQAKKITKSISKRYNIQINTYAHDLKYLLNKDDLS